MAYYLRVTNKNKGKYLQIYETFRVKGTKDVKSKCFKSLGYEKDLQSEEIGNPIEHYKKYVDDLNADKKIKKIISKTEKISEHITRIHGFCTEFMYLIEGSKAAVLIDTGCGFYSLKDCIHNLTNKPLKVLITHGHVDHAMGANEFEEIYLNHKDKSVYQLHSEEGFRLEGAK